MTTTTVATDASGELVVTTTLPPGTNTLEILGNVQPIVPGSPAVVSTVVDTSNDGTGGRNAFGLDRISIKTVTLPQLAAERLSGFVPGTGLNIEVIGAKTTGQFVVLPNAFADSALIAAAVSESSSRLETDFARLDSVEAVSRPPAGVLESLKVPLSSEALMSRIFADSELNVPTRLTDLSIPKSVRWLSVTAEIHGYVPGSIVYLAITSKPIVFAEAKVDAKGVARLTGAFPLEVAGTGGHRIRVVGIRQIQGVALDDAGAVQLSQDAIEKISQFDLQTSATVRISGQNLWGGFHSAIRVVPLHAPLPWWTIILVGWTAFLILLAGLRRKIAGRRERVIASVLMLIAAIPSQYLGWMKAAYVINGWGLAVLVLGIVLAWLVPRFRQSKRAQEFEEISD